MIGCIVVGILVGIGWSQLSGQSAFSKVPVSISAICIFVSIVIALVSSRIKLRQDKWGRLMTVVWLAGPIIGLVTGEMLAKSSLRTALMLSGASMFVLGFCFAFRIPNESKDVLNHENAEASGD